MSHGLHIRSLAALALLVMCAAPPAAAKYPERPVTIVVSVAPGAGPDVTRACWPTASRTCGNSR